MALGSGQQRCSANDIAVCHGDRVGLKRVGTVRREVKDPLRPSRCEGTLHVFAIGNVALDATQVREIVEPSGVRQRLEDRKDVVTVLDQAVDQVGADKSGSAGYKTADGVLSLASAASVSSCAPFGEAGRLRISATMYGGLRFTSS